MKKIYIFTRMVLLFGALLCFTDLWAQNAITGRVSDAKDDSALPGIAVTIKGTTTGTATDPDGKFTLSNVASNAILVFSFIGYTTQEVPVGNQTTINVKLAEDIKTLSEVVVIGYGEQRKQDATGGVVALTPKDYNKGIIASPEQLLQGRAAGVQVSPASGEPGAGINIRIRGTSSIRGGNNPLFVVDGIPLDGGNTSDGNADFGVGTASARNPLTFMNPADIENITVLKDASASAIYGARGANGVVLITTRKGKSGEAALNFSASSSASSTLKRYDLLNASEFLNEVGKFGGNVSDPAVNAGSDTDWQKEIFRTAISQNYSLNFGGGNDDTKYYFSLGYSDQQGIMKKSGLTRLNGRVNATHELFKDKVILELNLTTSGVKDQYVPFGDNPGSQGNILGMALQSNPTYPILNSQGRYYTPSGYEPNGEAKGDFRNASATLNLIDDNGNTNRTLARISASWKIISGLTYKLNFGVDNSSAIRRTAVYPSLPGFQGVQVNGYLDVKRGFANVQERNRSAVLIEHTLNYTAKVGPGTLEALAGFAYQKFENRGNFQQASRFLPAVLNSGIALYDAMGGVDNKDIGTTVKDSVKVYNPYAPTAPNVPRPPLANPTEADKLLYGNYSYTKVDVHKSYFAGTDRTQNELQSYFGRLNYNILEKYIFTATLRVDGSSRFGINNKYGYFPSLAGAWRISEEDFLRDGIFSDLKLRVNWGITGNQEYPGNTSKVIYTFEPNNAAANPQNNPNPNIKWEQTNQYGAGLDFAFLQGRLTGTVDYFKKGTKDLIFQAVYAQPAAAIYKWINLPGNVSNEGAELTLNYNVLEGKKLSWQVSYNMTYLKNKVTGINTIINTGTIGGQGLSGAYAQQIRDNYPVGAFFLRQFGGYDESGLGIYPNGEDLTYAGNAIPKFNFGLNNAFTYGRFDLSFFFNAAAGFYVYNNTTNAIFTAGNLRNARNVTKNVVGNGESPNNFAEVSTRFLEKGDFIRLSNLTLGYNVTLPTGAYAKSLRVFATGQNLLLFTKYSGIDPEVNTNKAIDGVPSIGIDYTAFPSARSFTIGLSAGF
ncbi:MAG: SusC/RagA family TonB-linked outer membrane protein [Bacteroidota bacterium]